MGAVTEEEVETFLNSLRAADVDKKVNLIQLWGIKLEDLEALPDRSIDAITLLVSPFLRSPSHLLVTSTLSSFLPFFLPLIPTSHAQSHLRVAILSLLPSLLEKLNDPKDKVHGPARVCVALLGAKCYEAEGTQLAQPVKGKERDSLTSLWESSVKDALGGRGVRVKLEVLKILGKLRNEPVAKLPLKPWLPSLVALLEDSDGSVRDSARETVVELLSPPSTPAAARSELKKLMLARGVRKSISDSIIARVLGGAVTAGTGTPARDGASTPSNLSAAGPRHDGPTSTGDTLDIVYIASAKDLDNEFRAMIPHFAGKETEHNWGPRERSLVRVRGMLRGKAFTNQPEAFLQGLKAGLVEGLVKTLMSLRTTVAQQSCALVQELAEALGPSLDPSLDLLLPTLGKMAGLTKRIIAEKSQKAVTAILVHTSPAPAKLIGHIAAAVQDKSIQTRQYGAGHLKTYLESQARDHRGLVEGTPGATEQIHQLLKKCLADTNPLVREQGRLAFWSFEKVWPSQASALLTTLDGPARKQLEKANPRMGATPVSSKISKPKTPRSSAMSALLAAKRAQAAELAARRAAEGDDPSQPIIEVLPLDGSPSIKVPRSPSSAPSEGTVTPRKGLQSPTPGNAPSRVFTSSESPEATTTEPRDRSDGADATTTNISAGASEERQDLVSSPARSVGDALPGISRPCTPVEKSGNTDKSDQQPGHRDMEGSVGPNPVASAGLQTPKTNMRKSGIPVRSPPRNGSSPSSTRPKSVQRSSFTSSHSVASTLSRALSRSPSLKVDPVAFSESDTPSKLSYASGLHPRYSPQETRRMAYPRIGGPSTTSMDHLPNSPADEQIRAQAAQAFSAAQQLLDFDDDQDAMADVPVTPIRSNNRQAPPSAYRTPSSGYNGMPKQSWEDSPRAMTPKLLKLLQSRGYERSWWNERRKLLDQMASVKQDKPSAGSTIESDVERLALGETSVSSLQSIGLFSAAHPVSASDMLSGDNGASARELWSRTRLFDRVFEGLVNLLRPGLTSDVLEQGIVTLWELVQNQWPLCEDREDSLLDSLFQLRTSTSSMVLEATNAMVSLLTEVCDPPFLLSLLHSALERFIGTVRMGAGLPSKEQVYGERAAAAGYSFGLNAMGMCILHLPQEAVEVEAKQLAGPVMEALRLDSSSAVMARQAAHRVILAVQCVIADDVRTLALFPRLTAGQRSFATYLMQQNGVMGRAGDQAEADARRRTVLNELVGGLAKGARGS